MNIDLKFASRKPLPSWSPSFQVQKQEAEDSAPTHAFLHEKEPLRKDTHTDPGGSNTEEPQH